MSCLSGIHPQPNIIPLPLERSHLRIMGIGHCDREFLSLHRSQSPVQRSSAVLLHPLLLGQVKRCWVVSYSITGNFDTERSSCCSPAEFIWKNIRAITQSNNHHHQKHRSICWWEIYLRRCGRNSVGGGFVSENIFIHSIGLREVLFFSFFGQMKSQIVLSGEKAPIRDPNQKFPTPLSRLER